MWNFKENESELKLWTMKIHFQVDTLKAKTSDLIFFSKSTPFKSHIFFKTRFFILK